MGNIDRLGDMFLDLVPQIVPSCRALPASDWDALRTGDDDYFMDRRFLSFHATAGGPRRPGINTSDIMALPNQLNQGGNSEFGCPHVYDSWFVLL